MSKHAEINGRIWISTPQGMYLGDGRVTLLKQIEKHGSITAAAQSMQMSYKKAWRLVQSMNTQGNTPLVLKKTGGAGGGGAALSDEGKKAIRLYERIRTEHQAFLQQKTKEYWDE